MDDNLTLLEEFQKGLRTITILGVKLYVDKWETNVAATYLVPSSFWHCIDK